MCVLYSLTVLELNFVKGFFIEFIIVMTTVQILSDLLKRSWNDRISPHLSVLYFVTLSLWSCQRCGTKYCSTVHNVIRKKSAVKFASSGFRRVGAKLHPPATGSRSGQAATQGFRPTT